MDSKKAVWQLKEIKKLVEKFGEGPRLAAEGWGENWQMLVAIILSAQTRDTKTISVCNELFRKYKKVGDLALASLGKIESEIKSINFYKTKARNVKGCCEKIIEDGFIGESVEELMRLPGVGRKTANVYLVAVRDAAAIGVDTHVGRISRKMGWTKETNPHKVEKDLERLFPKRYWNSINWILVRFGQSIGRSRAREDEVLSEIIENRNYFLLMFFRFFARIARRSNNLVTLIFFLPIFVGFLIVSPALVEMILFRSCIGIFWSFGISRFLWSEPGLIMTFCIHLFM